MQRVLGVDARVDRIIAQARHALAHDTGALKSAAHDGLSSPDAVRSGAMGERSVCIGAILIAFPHVGRLADRPGAPMAIAISSLEGLVAVAVSCRSSPEVLAAQGTPAF